MYKYGVLCIVSINTIFFFLFHFYHGIRALVMKATSKHLEVDLSPRWTPPNLGSFSYCLVDRDSISKQCSVFHGHPPGSLRQPPSKLNKCHHAMPSSPPYADGILYYRPSSASSCRSKADVNLQLLPGQRPLLLVPASHYSEKCRCRRPYHSSPSSRNSPLCCYSSSSNDLLFSQAVVLCFFFTSTSSIRNHFQVPNYRTSAQRLQHYCIEICSFTQY